MVTVAVEEAAHGKATHLIPPAPLTVAVATSSTLALDSVMHNTTFEAVHATSVPQETELRLGGLTFPSSDV